jgi:hypothetical protein
MNIKTKYQNLKTKYNYLIILININYIFLILLDFIRDSNLSYYYLTKFSKILYIHIIMNILSISKIKFALLVNYLSKLENLLMQNLNIFLTSYDNNYNITNIKNIIIFIVINLTFYFVIFVYIFIKIKSDSLFNRKLIIIFLTQMNIIKIIYNIFIFIFKIFILYCEAIGYNINLEANIIIAKKIFINFINYYFTNFNLGFKNINLIFLNRVDTFQKLINCDLDSNSKVEVSIDSVPKFNSSNSVSNTESEKNFDSIVTEEIKFLNFKDLSIEDKKSYVLNHYENKGLTPTFYTINWLTDKVQSNTDGNKYNVDIFINNYLNQILKLERDTQLKSFAFHRDKPFLRHLVYKTPLEYPYVIPAKKNISEFEES